MGNVLGVVRARGRRDKEASLRRKDERLIIFVWVRRQLSKLSDETQPRTTQPRTTQPMEDMSTRRSLDLDLGDCDDVTEWEQTSAPGTPEGPLSPAGPTALAVEDGSICGQTSIDDAPGSPDPLQALLRARSPVREGEEEAARPEAGGSAVVIHRMELCASLDAICLPSPDPEEEQMRTEAARAAAEAATAKLEEELDRKRAEENSCAPPPPRTWDALATAQPVAVDVSNSPTRAHRRRHRRSRAKGGRTRQRTGGSHAGKAGDRARA